MLGGIGKVAGQIAEQIGEPIGSGLGGAIGQAFEGSRLVDALATSMGAVGEGADEAAEGATVTVEAAAGGEAMDADVVDADVDPAMEIDTDDTDSYSTDTVESTGE